MNGHMTIQRISLSLILTLIASCAIISGQEIEKKAPANEIESTGETNEVFPPTRISPIFGEAAGKVTDSEGNPLSGASVVLSRTTSTIGNSFGLDRYPHAKSNERVRVPVVLSDECFQSSLRLPGIPGYMRRIRTAASCTRFARS